MIFLGIDPGISGGIVAISDSNSPAKVIAAHKMPKTTEGVVETIQTITDTKEQILAIVEKVWGFPRDGSRQITTFMKNAGILEGILAVLKIQIVYVSPQKWQRALGVYAITRALADTITKKKNIHKQQALELFPNTKIPAPASLTLFTN